MSEFWRGVAGFTPFIVMTNNASGIKVELKDLIGAVIIGCLSAVGGSVMTTQRLDVTVTALATNVANMAKATENLQAEIHNVKTDLKVLEARVSIAHPEAMPSMSGMSGDRRPK